MREFDFMTLSRSVRLSLVSLGLAAILGCDSGGPTANTTPTGPATAPPPGTKSKETTGPKSGSKSAEVVPKPTAAD
jgi:hypothetical protein